MGLHLNSYAVLDLKNNNLELQSFSQLAWLLSASLGMHSIAKLLPGRGRNSFEKGSA